ncbi:MAG: multifunctional CCA tRNA nucleotidyl transferase/2'3'-cyclic phosphodiesterase/2'nucleotidase/phosphatase [Burkholderiales bacterium]|nr:multifunctional CCA tRNA nucleotidyl transferase/2'3'-cyclic phosphodiesterase/2'nucleotidase/phosphatase [Burkholderiales bacterium]PZN04862.1 MAG: multifunctional CCA tRNA nucleotidyl transferase/2'3'-cyclic phosphodiesterase/2'nucleotidase/phosphatase [Pseudomonadota bacterium]
MKIYAVGGAVRDQLLGMPVKDRDYVVVGATPEAMIARGFRPVGKDFPVFLHPETNEEYALARTERKTGRGYTGFQFYAAPDVTLEQDLARRDLTINALAQDEHGNLIDPYGGLADLRAGILRHVSPAFVEDPVRILRVARFAARFGFSVAPETMALMRTMVDNGEVDALVPERVWQEFAKGLMEERPARMFTVLDECGALTRVLPEWQALDAARALAALNEAADRRAALPVRYAALWAGATPETVEAACERLRAPGDCRDLAILAARHGRALEAAETQDAATLVGLLQDVDAFRRPERYASLLDAVACDAKARGRSLEPARMRLGTALDAARRVDAGAVARRHPSRIAEAVREARVAAAEAALQGTAAR